MKFATVVLAFTLAACQTDAPPVGFSGGAASRDRSDGGEHPGPGDGVANGPPTLQVVQNAVGSIGIIDGDGNWIGEFTQECEDKCNGAGVTCGIVEDCCCVGTCLDLAEECAAAVEAGDTFTEKLPHAP